MPPALRSLLALSFVAIFAACGDDDDAPAPLDLGVDAHVADLGTDASAVDAALGDAAPTLDAHLADGSATLDASGGCTSDSECTSGSEWCVEGACVVCDDSAMLCRIVCEDGWSLYERNGCHPCECAPPNQCVIDADCHTGDKCVAGAFCWCSAADGSCCQGNTCAAEGCEGAPPVGCVVRGCPMGETCDTRPSKSVCTSTGCTCEAGGTWACTPDCGGGACVAATP